MDNPKIKALLGYIGARLIHSPLTAEAPQSFNMVGGFLFYMILTRYLVICPCQFDFDCKCLWDLWENHYILFCKSVYFV